MCETHKKKKKKKEINQINELRMATIKMSGYTYSYTFSVFFLLHAFLIICIIMIYIWSYLFFQQYHLLHRCNIIFCIFFSLSKIRINKRVYRDDGGATSTLYVREEKEEDEKVNVYYFKSVVIVNDKLIKIILKCGKLRQQFVRKLFTHAQVYVFFY